MTGSAVRVVLVRPWTDAHGGGGCCSGDPSGGITREPEHHGHTRHDPEALLVGEAYRRLRAELPGVDVQVVSAGNTAFLLPSSYRAVRRRRGVLGALREASRATTAGAVLVDGERVGDLSRLGVDGVLREVRARVAT